MAFTGTTHVPMDAVVEDVSTTGEAKSAVLAESYLSGDPAVVGSRVRDLE